MLMFLSAIKVGNLDGDGWLYLFNGGRGRECGGKGRGEEPYFLRDPFRSNDLCES